MSVARYSSFDAQGAPQTITEVPIETVPMSGGGLQTVQVPVTAAVTADAQSGTANLQLTAVYGDNVAISFTTLAVPGAVGTAARAARPGRTRRVVVELAHFHRFRAVGARGKRAAAADSSPPCVWTGSGSLDEHSARIGELHVANVSGASATYTYSVQADSTFGVEVSDSGPTSGYSESGTASVTNSIGGSGGFTGGQGFLWYVVSDFYSETFGSNINPLNGDPACGARYMTQVVQAIGGATQGTNQPPANPYGSCTSDPNGWTQLQPYSGYWGSDYGRSESYSVALTIFGVGLYGDTGFSTNIHIEYHNSGPNWLYVCGNAPLPDAPILYET